MQIRDIRTHRLSVPFEEPPKTGFLTLQDMDFLVVEVETDQSTGTGFLHPLAGGMRTIETCIHEMMKPLLIGADGSDPAVLWRKMWDATFIQGRMGITVMAQSALDIALWDALGNAREQPLWKLWGGSGDPIKAYGSGCFRGLGHDGMIAKAKAFVDQGYTAIKMQVAHVFTPDEDVVNVRDMRAELGPDIEIMVDVNQGWDVDTAIATGRKLDEFGLTWLEEPVIADDFDGYHTIAAAVETPIVGGENHFCHHDLKPFFASGAVPILQPDIMRGGFTELRVIAEHAEKAEIAIAPHLFPEYSSHLLAAIPNASWLEYMGWYDTLFVEPLKPVNSMITPPDRPGHGMTLRTELFVDCKAPA